MILTRRIGHRLHASDASDLSVQSTLHYRTSCVDTHSSCRHRTPASHSCTAALPDQPTPRNEAAKAILAQIFPAKASASSTATGGTSTVPAKRKTPTSSNPKKAAQIRQVELMKMRRRAQPADPRDKNRNVPIGERLHVKVSAEGKDEEKLFWFQKVG